MRWGRGGVAALAALLMSSAPAGALDRGAELVTRSSYDDNMEINGGGMLFLAASRDLSRVVFRTPQHLHRADHDLEEDIYVRAGGRTRFLSKGPEEEDDDDDRPYDLQFEAASTDARRVVWTSDQHVTADDRDSRTGRSGGWDLFLTEHGHTRRLSKGPRGGNGDHNAEFGGASRDLSRVFFVTFERLVDADRDEDSDVYMWRGGKTTLVPIAHKGSIGSVESVSADGRHVFLVSSNRLTASDSDDETDVFDWDGRKLRQVSRGPAGGNGPFPVGEELEESLAATTADGSRAWFYTRERLTSSDRDAQMDLYQYAAGRTVLVSTGSAGGNGPFDVGDPPGVSEGPSPGRLYAVSSSGRAIFGTVERLTPDDQDGALDVYSRDNGHTTLLSPPGGGPKEDRGVGVAGQSEDLSRILLASRERLTPDDRDRSIDVFELRSGRLRRLTGGPAGGNRDEPFYFDGYGYWRPTDARLAIASEDARRIVFLTGERLSDADHGAPGMYEHGPEGTSLIRFRTDKGRRPDPTMSPVAMTADGSAFVFYSSRRLARADDNYYPDLYVAGAG